MIKTGSYSQNGVLKRVSRITWVYCKVAIVWISYYNYSIVVLQNN